MDTLRTINISDTGQWRLIAYIGGKGIGAWLKSTEDPTLPVAELFAAQWEADPDGLLANIENAVYDHPRILDDFSADIILETGKALWVPRPELIEPDCEPEEMCDRWFGALWPEHETDYITDEYDDMLCLHMLAPGLKSFIARTFPGARVQCHQTVLVRNLAGRAADDPRMYLDIRDGVVDILLFSGRNLLSSSTHSWESETDIMWHAFNLLEVYGVNPRKAQICLSGDRRVRESLARSMRQYLGFVMLTMVPRVESATPMPLAAIFCAARNNFNNQSQ